LINRLDSLVRGGGTPFFTRIIRRDANAGGYVSTAQTARMLASQGAKNESRLLRHLTGIRAATTILALAALILFLRYAKDLLIPMTAGLVIAAILGPLTERLLPIVRSGAIAAAVSVLSVLLLVGGGAYLISDDLVVALERLPEMSRQIKERVALDPPSSNPVKKIAEAAQNLEEAATMSSSPAPAATTAAGAPQKSARAPAKADAAPAEPRPSWLRTQLLLGSTTILQGVAEVSVALLIAFFVLASGPMLRRKLFRASGYHRRQRQRFRRILYQSCKQVRLYVLILLVTNVAIAFATWAVFLLLGFDHAGLWALFAGVVHIVPYVGSIALAVVAAAFQYLSAGSVLQSVNYGIVILVVVSLLGTLLPTWLQSRTSRMNQVAIFVGVLFWGWMWGLWGLFLGAPIVVIMKVVCDNVTALRGAARLLGD
jgi:predicted PurR-regulated permease PerM